MKVTASQPVISIDELKRTLSEEFSGRLSCKIFGLGKSKTIVATESPVAGVQISIRKDEISVQGMPSPILTLLGMTELAVLLLPFIGWWWRSDWKSLERDVAIFLNSKYK